MATGFVHDERYLDHDTGEGHPERPERLTAIVNELRTEGLLQKLIPIDARPVAVQWIDAVHTAGYRARIETLCNRGGGAIDADTIVSADSYDVALQAVGGVLAACDEVMAGRCDNAFCAVRPPGHHAESHRPMGFCLFNNVAIAARYLQKNHGIERVMIIDWDVHHGNGTQEIFEADATVLYVSLHQWPLYPGTGARHERGVGVGIGATLNIPLDAGSGESDYEVAFRQVMEAGREFRPDFLLVSAGYDAHLRDPLASMRLTADGFAQMSASVVALALEQCSGRIIALLEGGYDLQGLATGVAETVRAFLESCDRAGDG